MLLAAPVTVRPALRASIAALARARPASMVMPIQSSLLEPDGLVVLISPFVVASMGIGLIAVVRSQMQAEYKSPAPTPGRRKREERKMFETRANQALSSLVSIGIPTAAAALVGFLYFDNLSLYLSSMLSDEMLKIISRDDQNAEFIQNFLTVLDLLFAILAGSAYKELYQQQVEVYEALYREVSVARSLLEQLALVGQARPWYPDALGCMRTYLDDDLRRPEISPVAQLASRPMEDPLESIMYMTSIGVPSIVYESVKDLRQARGERLGALQRKFPSIGIVLLYLLAAAELTAFPLLGAGTARISETPELATVSILELQSLLFASVCGCVVLVLRIIQELWQPRGGVFNVDDVLQQMVFGLELELDDRLGEVRRVSTPLPGSGAVSDIES